MINYLSIFRIDKYTLKNDNICATPNCEVGPESHRIFIKDSLAAFYKLLFMRCKMKNFKLISSLAVAGLMILTAGMANAAPVATSPWSNPATLGDTCAGWGTVTASYQCTYREDEVHDDPDNPAPGMFGQQGWTQLDKIDAQSGTGENSFLTLTPGASTPNAGAWSFASNPWATNPDNDVAMLFKGSTGMVSFLITPDALSGTYNMLLQGHDISHVSLWEIDSDSLNPPDAVPVPAAVWLFGSGLLGLVGLGRKKAQA